MKKTVSIINKYETIEFQIKNVTEIDLSFLQLFYALRIKSNTLNKKFIVITEFQAEIKRLIENAGLTSLFC
jgi:anti-anti-sigma regulatory factor